MRYSMLTPFQPAKAREQHPEVDAVAAGSVVKRKRVKEDDDEEARGDGRVPCQVGPDH